jgi:hypothetical protein
VEYQRCVEKYDEFLGITWLFGLINIDDLAVDSSTVASKKGGKK